MSADNVANVTILDRAYSIKCPKENMSALTTSAKYLDEQARKVREVCQAANTERVLVVAALNIVQELMTLKNEKNHINQLQERIARFLEKKEEAMTEC